VVGICELCQEDPCVCLERYCNHEHKTYQAEERDTNVPESYTCDNCGKDLDIPEPDWDLMNKE
jgi:hypothetical protein